MRCVRTINIGLLIALASFCQMIYAADIELKQSDATIEVIIDGKHFTTYIFDAKDDPKFVRPYFFPVSADDGTPFTDDKQRVTGGDNHPHHRSFWVAQGDVNGVDHWSTKAGDKQPRQRHVGFEKVTKDTIVEHLAWESADRKSVLLDETRTIQFFVFPDGSRGVDLTVALKPHGSDPVTLGDTKEAGLCSVRLTKAISDTATLTNSEGKTGEPDTWGKPAEWCDISGKTNGKTYGVAVLDHPTNPRHPTRWHVRQYGLLTANPFGLHDFDKLKDRPGAMKLEPGKATTFRFRVVFHDGDAKSANLNEKFAAFAKQ